MVTSLGSALSSLDQLSSLVSGILALIGTAFAALIWLLRVSPRVRTRLVTGHLRKARFGEGRDASGALPRDAARRFRQVARLVASGEPVTAADGVERAVPHMLAKDPWSADGTLSLLAWCEFVSRPGRESLFGRLVAPDQVALVRTFVSSVVAYLDDFARLSLVSEDDASRQTAAFVSELSGAAVLTDAARSRSGLASHVLVRHSTRYGGDVDALPLSSPTAEDTWRRYADSHTPRGGTCRRAGEKLGDYDGRLPDLRGVGVAKSLIDGAVTFVLDTAETCYSASEKADHLGCKKLPSSADDPLTPRFVPDVSGWASRGFGANQRVSILTSYVSLIARGSTDPEGVVGRRADSQDPHDVLVLCRRSMATENGQGTLSATAGGLVELGADGSLDVNTSGAPDPVAAAIRECREEIGLEVDRRSVNPVCIFTCTIQGRDASEPDMTKRRKGQLVSVVLSLASVPMSLAELQAARARADHAVGGFEVDQLIGVAMYPGKVGCREFADTVARLSGELDQHGLLSCFYASVRAHGADKTMEAFSHAFKKKPWWLDPWSGEEGFPRLCRDPQSVRHRPERLTIWASLPDHLAANRVSV
ncbi:NUDIX hydrolase [Nocardioides sp.]|uniref:NUDIX hydrolase n=1 Tax=Nocardioides sp. TaxID=35761 RepID=UPI0035B2E3BE